MKVLIAGILILSGFFLGRVYAILFKREIYRRASIGPRWMLTFVSTFARHMFLFLLGFFILRLGVTALIMWVVSFLISFWYALLQSEKGQQ